MNEVYIKIDNSKIWTINNDFNHKNTIIFCGGGPGYPDYLSLVSQMLENQFNIIRWEYRGCGRSDKDNQYDIETVLLDIEEIRKHYKLENFIICGHSWGADIALFYAIKYSRNILAILHLCGIGVQFNYNWLIETSYNKYNIGEIELEYNYLIDYNTSKKASESYRKYIERPDLFKDILNLNIPTLLICAENDIRPIWPIQQLHSLIKNSKLIIIKNAQHNIWLTHYDEMKNYINNFVNLL